jgi:hypothetical protein
MPHTTSPKATLITALSFIDTCARRHMPHGHNFTIDYQNPDAGDPQPMQLDTFMSLIADLILDYHREENNDAA